MFITTVKSTNPDTPERAIALASHHARSKPRPDQKRVSTRKESEFSSKSYRDALQRAFNQAKLKIYFNPDMNKFVTLTYKGADHNYEDVLYDVKQFVKLERRRAGNKNLKYIYVMEFQKRGSIHVHMITNGKHETYKNKNNYESLTNWTKGYSSVLTIDDFDNNFKSYLYLFKYMRKSQRIGKTFVHASRNLKNYEEVTGNILKSPTWDIHHYEKTEADLDYRKLTFHRYFLQAKTDFKSLSDSITADLKSNIDAHR